MKIKMNKRNEAIFFFFYEIYEYLPAFIQLLLYLYFFPLTFVMILLHKIVRVMSVLEKVR